MYSIYSICLCVCLLDGITDVIIYNSPDDVKKKNRGFAFLEYDSHKSASAAKHRIGNGYTRIWGCDIIVDWADPQQEPDEETMSKVILTNMFSSLYGSLWKGWVFASKNLFLLLVRFNPTKLGLNQHSVIRT